MAARRTGRNLTKLEFNRTDGPRGARELSSSLMRAEARSRLLNYFRAERGEGARERKSFPVSRDAIYAPRINQARSLALVWNNARAYACALARPRLYLARSSWPGNKFASCPRARAIRACFMRAKERAGRLVVVALSDVAAINDARV